MKFPFRKGIICDFSIPNEPGVIFQSLTHLVTPMLCQQLNQSELENLFPRKVTSWDIGNIFRMTLIELPFQRYLVDLLNPSDQFRINSGSKIARCCPLFSILVKIELSSRILSRDFRMPPCHPDQTREHTLTSHNLISRHKHILHLYHPHSQ